MLIGLTGSPVAASVCHGLRHLLGAIDPAAIVLCGGAGAEAARAKIESLGALVAGLDGIRATLRIQYSAEHPTNVNRSWRKRT